MLRIGMLCNDSRLYQKDGKWLIAGDPTEGALVVAGVKKGLSHGSLLENYPRVGEIPFDSNRKRMSTIHRAEGRTVAYVKGAPDVVLGLCDSILVDGKVRKLSEEERKAVDSANSKMASDALRVLAFACRDVSGEEFTSQAVERKLVFVGLAGMIDPPREDVPGAIELCKKAGIKVVIITGDFALTAKAIARQIGLEDVSVISGFDLDKMDDRQLKRVLEGDVLFARNSPEHKLRVVSVLKDMGHIVAVTGDGVNDAPALKKSDIGVAMGITGTDVSKEASTMVLTDDNFASIVNAVREGRTVYDSIKKFLAYLFSSNMGEVVAVFSAMLLGMPLILTAIQILWINLVTDLGPALALGVDPPEAGIMERKPRNPKGRIINRRMFIRIMLAGLLLGFGTIAVFKWQLGLGATLVKAQTMAFTVIVLYQLVNVFNCRSEDKSLLSVGLFSNKWLWLAVGFSLAMQVLVTHLGFLQQMFNLTPLTPAEWLTAGAVSLTVLALDEGRKLVQK
jgi:Ca2+-transporting ATPase